MGKIYPKYVDFFDYNFTKEDFRGSNYIAVKKSEVEFIKALATWSLKT